MPVISRPLVRGGADVHVLTGTGEDAEHLGRPLASAAEPVGCGGLELGDIYVAVLLTQLHRLVDGGNTVIVVEHDLDVIATADWILDLGPGGGDAGEQVMASGPPAKVARSKRSVTAPYVARRLRAAGFWA